MREAIKWSLDLLNLSTDYCFVTEKIDGFVGVAVSSYEVIGKPFNA